MTESLVGGPDPQQPVPGGAPASSRVDAGPPSGLGAEWPKKAADAVDLVVDTIHDKAIRPVLLAARIVVFGLLIAVLGLVVLVLLSAGLLRLLDVYAFPGRVWISYAVLGGIFTLAGLFAWAKRTPRAGLSAGHD